MYTSFLKRVLGKVHFKEAVTPYKLYVCERENILSPLNEMQFMDCQRTVSLVYGLYQGLLVCTDRTDRTDRQTVLPHTRDKTRKYSKSS